MTMETFCNVRGVAIPTVITLSTVNSCTGAFGSGCVILLVYLKTPSLPLPSFPPVRPMLAALNTAITSGLEIPGAPSIGPLPATARRTAFLSDPRPWTPPVPAPEIVPRAQRQAALSLQFLRQLLCRFAAQPQAQFAQRRIEHLTQHQCGRRTCNRTFTRPYHVQNNVLERRVTIMPM